MKELQNTMGIDTEQSLSNTQENVNQKDNSKSFERNEIENTPFTEIYEEKKGWYIVMGDHQLSEPVKTQKENRKQLGNINYKFFTTLIASIVEIITNKEFNELKTKVNEEFQKIASEEITIN